ncbi:MAG: aminopeptidase P family N-terminal domain-containing protein, partial [Desulfobulbaceae bacterium]|nr:aminopeptidase P family N-terminal domain-containing protein [Desulfobulbaceae bacterium]
MTAIDQSLASVRRILKRRKLDALLVTQPENRRYLSGYSAGDTSINESSGVLLIPSVGEPFLFTDSRFDLQAAAEAPRYTVSLYPRGLLSLLGQLLPKLKIRRLAFESHYLLHATYLKLAKLADRHGMELEPCAGLVEALRARKSEDELTSIERSVRLNEEVFQEIYAGLTPGMS